MPETPRSTFRLTAQTRKQIEEIRQAKGGLYGQPTRTRIVEIAIDNLHRETCQSPPAGTPSKKDRVRSRPTE